MWRLPVKGSQIIKQQMATPQSIWRFFPISYLGMEFGNRIVLLESKSGPAPRTGPLFLAKKRWVQHAISRFERHPSSRQMGNVMKCRYLAWDRFSKICSINSSNAPFIRLCDDVFFFSNYCRFMSFIMHSGSFWVELTKFTDPRPLHSTSNTFAFWGAKKGLVGMSTWTRWWGIAPQKYWRCICMTWNSVLRSCSVMYLNIWYRYGHLWSK